MKEIKCFLEPISAILRAGPGTDDFGKPFEFSCTVVFEGTHAHLKGACGKYSRETLRVISKTLKAHGFETMSWEKKNNKERAVERKTG